jgi:photosystem II stability/assembly factor-like uncharacterized protein
MVAYVCTGDRLLRVDADGSVDEQLHGTGARCVAARLPHVLVGTRGHGAFASDDGGASWTHVELAERDVYSVAIGAADGALYAGTEPSRLFVSRNGAWEEREALQDIPSRERWSFPPRPWTHHVRWIAPDPQRAERVLVGIELGGLMSTEDGGASFSDHRPGAKLDVHQIAWHPSAEGQAYMAAGDGAAWSRDGGRTWEPADDGRDLRYCWGLAVDTGDRDRWFISAAAGPGAAHSGPRARGRLYRWEGAWRGLDVPGDSMPYGLAATEGALLAGMADGRLLVSPDGGDSWEELRARADSITALAAE